MSGALDGAVADAVSACSRAGSRGTGDKQRPNHRCEHARGTPHVRLPVHSTPSESVVQAPQAETGCSLQLIALDSDLCHA